MSEASFSIPPIPLVLSLFSLLLIVGFISPVTSGSECPLELLFHLCTRSQIMLSHNLAKCHIVLFLFLLLSFEGSLDILGVNLLLDMYLAMSVSF